MSDGVLYSHRVVLISAEIRKKAEGGTAEPKAQGSRRSRRRGGGV